MKLKLLAFVFAALAVSSAFAMLGQYSPRFYFATVGDELYADGSLAMDGECYALVWQRNGVTFKGFNATGTIGYDESATLPVDPQNCRVIAVFPAVTKEWIDADPEEGIDEGFWTSSCYGAHVAVEREFYALHHSGGSEPGTFSVYLFDTRKWVGGEAVVGGYDAANKRVPVLNGYGVVSYLETIDMIPGSDSVPIDSQKDSFDYDSAVPCYGDTDPSFEEYKNSSIAAASAVPAEALANIKVGAPEVGDGEVTISVTGVPAYLRIDLSAATELGDVGKAGTLVGEPKQGGETLTWTVKTNGKKGFYKVVRQPLK